MDLTRFALTLQVPELSRALQVALVRGLALRPRRWALAEWPMGLSCKEPKRLSCRSFPFLYIPFQLRSHSHEP